MPSVRVKVKYSSTGDTPSAVTTVSVSVSKKDPTESEVSAVLSKRYPKWNFYILEIK